MNIQIAAEQTKHLIKKQLINKHPHNGWPTLPSELAYPHAIYMLDSIQDERVTGEKAHRWLGWAQCAAVAAGAGTLDDMKAINHTS